MTSWRSVDGEALRGVLANLRATSWSWTPADVTAVATKMGWAMVETIAGKGAFAQAPWSLGDDDIELTFAGDRVNDVIIPLTVNMSAKDAQAQTVLSGAFADAAAVATATLGAPTQAASGPRPQLRWRGSDSTILLKHVGVAIELVWANNTFQDHWDQLRGEAK